MTENNITEPVEGEGESVSEEDSTLVKDLRKQIKEAQRELKAVPTRSEIEAEVRAAVARTSAIESQLVAFNLPPGLADTVEGKLGDAEVSAEAVTAALTAIGFEVTAPSEGEEGTSETEQPNAEQVANVANLGGQVAQAANQQTPDNLTDKINAATDPSELAQIMAEAGMSN